MHFSSPRLEMRRVTRRDRKTGRARVVLQPPAWTGHADFVQPFEFIRFVRNSREAGLPLFDVMLEAKMTDVALERLRADLVRYAPDVEAMFCLTAEEKTMA